MVYVAIMKMLPSIVVLMGLSLATTACDRSPNAQQDIERLDRDLTNAGDPAVASAINDPIMVDPALTQSSNVNAIRPPDRPRSGAVPDVAIGARATRRAPGPLASAPPPAKDCPSCAAKRESLTLGALAKRQRDGGVVRCADRLRYSASWSTRLPAALPMYPDARVIEAAGTDGAGCTLRVVSFESSAAVERVIDWYYTRAKQGGYSAAHEADGAQHVLGGTRRDAAYVAYVSVRAGGGSAVDFVSNAGR